MMTEADNRLRYTQVGPMQISTIRTHPAAAHPYETAVLDGPLSGRSEYHSSEAEARAGHDEWAGVARMTGRPDPAS